MSYFHAKGNCGILVGLEEYTNDFFQRVALSSTSQTGWGTKVVRHLADLPQRSARCYRGSGW